MDFEPQYRLVFMPSQLGWMALVGDGKYVCQLTFGFQSSEAAVAALDHGLLAHATQENWNLSLVQRLLDFAAGQPVDFRDVPIDNKRLPPFSQRVIQCCRQIEYGQTSTYSELASKAGSPLAARAVGNCMANNKIPLIVPCHRVIASGGKMGNYSAPGGTQTKCRLLAMEGSLRIE